ncbi:hypothetical protein [Pectobacterium sp. IFB5596]|uniref:hypothetical protein n=1 Tax=Pectobacterium sp. IFB5596 TaxID=1839803 RepID=UPI001F192D97|nr:hypothetical protein [Pectobacterium sp. IFB5596]MCE9730891.1 hypothetical protein [Pectobacterium sp. IFB5596]
MKVKIVLMALFFSTAAQAVVTELNDAQLANIHGKGLIAPIPGIIYPPLFPPKKPWTGTGSGYVNPWVNIKFPKYSTLNMAGNPGIKAPLEGFLTITEREPFYGIHYINMLHDFGVDEDHKTYFPNSEYFQKGAITITDTGNGNKYTVIGDIWRASKSKNGGFNDANAPIVEEYYRVINNDGTMSNTALRWAKWTRNINVTSW